MRRIVHRLMICALIITMIFTFAGCSNTDTENELPPEAIKAKLTSIKMPFDLEEDPETGKKLNMYTVCHSGEDFLIVANVYDDIITATEVIHPQIRTSGLYVLDYKENSSEFYDLKSDSVIYSAVPYKNGIIYVESKMDDGNIQDPIYKWDIAYFDGNSQSIIDSGYSKNQTATEVTLIGETPVYVSEQTASGMTSVSVKKIVDLNSETIDSVENAEKYSIVETNGKTYLLSLFDSQREKVILCAGNEEKLYLQHELDDVFNSGTLNADYIVASIGEETEAIKLVGIPLDGSESKDLKQTKRWWRMTGSSGKYCVAVDDNFNPYYIDIEENIVGEIILTDEMGDNILVKSFYPVGEDKYILSINDETYYLMELS